MWGCFRGCFATYEAKAARPGRDEGVRAKPAKVSKTSSCSSSFGFLQLPEEPVIDIMKYLDIGELTAVETTCSDVRMCCGQAWCSLGQQRLPGVQLVRRDDSCSSTEKEEGCFEFLRICLSLYCFGSQRTHRRWKLDNEVSVCKKGYVDFVDQVHTLPGRAAVQTKRGDGRLKFVNKFELHDYVQLGYQVSTKNSAGGLYIEVGYETTADFEISLESSVDERRITFNPEYGTVRQASGKNYKLYPLKATLTKDFDLCCNAQVGLYIIDGKVAFIRRSDLGDECTGFVGEFGGHEGEYLIPSLSFSRPIDIVKSHCRYSVSLNKVVVEPPVPIRWKRSERRFVEMNPDGGDPLVYTFPA